jgi:hypothetical protein
LNLIVIDLITELEMLKLLGRFYNIFFFLISRVRGYARSWSALKSRVYNFFSSIFVGEIVFGEHIKINRKITVQA